MATFEIGKSYESLDSGYQPIRILKRTEKTIWVENECCKWMMRVKHDDKGNEFVVDSCLPRKWREAFMYSALWEVRA